MRSCSTWPDPGVASIATASLEAHGQERMLMTIRHTPLPGGLAVQHRRGRAAIAGQLAEVLTCRQAC